MSEDDRDGGLQPKKLLQLQQAQVQDKPASAPQAEDEAGGTDENSGEPTIDQARIDAKLKGLYGELLEAPIPDRFKQLIEEMEAQERKK